MRASILFFLVFAQLLFGAHGQSARRGRRGRVFATSEQELQDAFAELEPDQTIILDFTTVELTATLTVNVRGVTIRGKSERAKIGCPQNGGALKIQAPVTLKNVAFVNCTIGPAVQVEPLDAENSSNVTATFRDVLFQGNRVSASGIRSGIEINGCPVFGRCNGSIVKVVIENCQFTENRAESGSAVYCYRCALKIRNSLFQKNTADFTGGAIFILDKLSTLEIDGSTFQENRVKKVGQSKEIWQPSGLPLERTRYFFFSFPEGQGGAIGLRSISSFRLTNCTFYRNQAPAGGAVAMLCQDQFGENSENDEYEFKITNCTFEENSANYSSGQRTEREENKHGGAIYLVSSLSGLRLSLENVTFRKNTALYGGALHMVTSSVTSQKMENCIFEGNEANGLGGALIIRGEGHVILQQTNFTDNKAEHGGAIVLTNYASLVVEGLEGINADQRTGIPCYFTNNSAIDGGAIAGIASGDVELNDAVFDKNRAERKGGGIYFADANAVVKVFQSVFSNNFALKGGGAAFIATNKIRIDSVIGGLPTFFRDNSAITGAGAYVSASHRRENSVNIRNAIFESNQALKFEEAFSPSPVDVNDVSSFACGNGGGGGLCLVVDNVPDDSIADIMVSKSEFRNNRALVGGGMFVKVANETWNDNLLIKKCPDPSPSRHSCRLLVFEDVTIINNVAEFGGGGIHASDPSKIIVRCPDNTSYTFLISALNITKQNICLNLEGNRVLDSEGVFGPHLSSSAFSLSVTSPVGPINGVKGGSIILPPCEECNSNERQGVLVEIKDAFEQTITGGIPDFEFYVTLISPNITGQQIYQASKGIFNIDGTIGTGISSSSEVLIQLDQIPQLTETLVFSTRACYPGETDAGGVCVPCDIDSYSFISSVDCKECPSKAVCSGEAVLVPKDGYWHSSPFSTQIHRCIVEEACIYDNRIDLLAEYYSDIDLVREHLAILDMDSTLRDFAEYNQCSEGYTGVLCGSCKQGYGHFAGGECVKCTQNSTVSLIILLIIFLWIFILIGFNIFLTLLSTRNQIEITSQLSRKDRMLVSEHPPSRHSNSGVQEMQGIKTSKQCIQNRPSILSAFVPSSLGSDLSSIKHIVALEQNNELIKILINYFQVTSTALSIAVGWSDALTGFLAIQSLVISVMNGSSIIPVDCAVSHVGTQSKSIAALWIRVCIPLVLLIVFLLLIFVDYTFKYRLDHHSRCKDQHPQQSKDRNPQKSKNENPQTRKNQNSRRSVTYSIVVTLFLVYFFYIDLTSEFMRALNCIEVDEEDEGQEAYRRYAIATGRRFWAEDTSLRCFRGKHTVTGVLGVLGLCFFSIAAVIAYGVFLSQNRNRVAEPAFLARYGFLYFSYCTEKTIALFWECFVFIRKAFIAAVVVFAFPLGPNLQATLALGVLLLALTAHLFVHPFEECTGVIPSVPSVSGEEQKRRWLRFNDYMSLNRLESASMMSTIFVFYTGIIMHDDKTTEGGKYAITSFTLVINILFILFMLYRIYAAIIITIELHIERYDAETNIPEKGSYSPIALFWKLMLLRELDNNGRSVQIL